MGKRGSQLWSRDELPVGTIRIRRHSRRVSARMVKICNDGPRGRRWITLARAWWLENRGPIPLGMRVVHGDGDPLNDDPANYVLATAGDVAYLAREWDPDLDRRNAEACRVATIRCNQDRSRVRRAREYLPTRWYAVDVAGRRVLNEPYRSRLELARRLTGLDLQAPSGRGLAGLWLGWPQLNQTAAIMAAVLAGEEDAVRSDRLLSAIEELGRFHGWLRKPLLPASVWTNGSFVLKRLGWIQVTRGLGNRRWYRLRTPAIASRQPPVPWVAVRGHEVKDRFPGFARGCVGESVFLPAG